MTSIDDNKKLRELSQKVENFEVSNNNKINTNQTNTLLTLIIPILVTSVIFFTRPSFILKKKRFSNSDNLKNCEINYLYLAIIFFIVYLLVVMLYSNS